jgi:transposase InsO family protein
MVYAIKNDTDPVLNALLMVLWRREPKNKVLIHSDQGSHNTPAMNGKHFSSIIILKAI